MPTRGLVLLLASHLLVGALCYYLGTRMGQSPEAGESMAAGAVPVPPPWGAPKDPDPRLQIPRRKSPVEARHEPTAEQAQTAKKRIERWNQLSKEEQALFHRALAEARRETLSDVQRLRTAVGEGRVSHAALAEVVNPHALYERIEPGELSDSEAVGQKLAGVIRSVVEEKLASSAP